MTRPIQSVVLAALLVVQAGVLVSEVSPEGGAGSTSAKELELLRNDVERLRKERDGYRADLKRVEDGVSSDLKVLSAQLTKDIKQDFYDFAQTFLWVLGILVVVATVGGFWKLSDIITERIGQKVAEKEKDFVRLREQVFDVLVQFKVQAAEAVRDVSERRKTVEAASEQALNQVQALVAKVSVSSARIAMQIQGGPELDELKEAILNGRLADALRLAEELARQDPNYQKHVLTILTLSSNPMYRERAKAMLAAEGEPRHYLRMTYAYWENADYSAAIGLAEEGLKVSEALEAGDKRDGAIHAFKNNLAYYYAEVGLAENAGLARLYAEESLAFQRAREKRPERIAAALGTRAFVKIAFGNETEIREGMREAAEAWKGGARQDLYVKHLARANQRLGTTPGAAL